uniref:Uncharacterized protein n=1 Tax=Parascaris equorum TaxID=6256 RepID=A0A914RUY4_PAREQ
MTITNLTKPNDHLHRRAYLMTAANSFCRTAGI